MAKISIGESTGSSRLSADLNLAHNSSFEISIGDGRDMSIREIKVLERDALEIQRRLAEFDRAVENVVLGLPNETQRKNLRGEAKKFRTAATKTVESKRRVPITTKGIVDAAKTIGAAATPLLAVAAKVVEIIGKAHGLGA